jgi:hypothetical protein
MNPSQFGRTLHRSTAESAQGKRPLFIAAIYHQSSIINHQSSIINHQSSIINHQSSIIKIVLTLDWQSSVSELR